jgi:hypothetical protein
VNPGDLETSAVFRELVDEVRALEAKLYDGPNAPQDEQSVLEGYKWIFSILQVAFDAYVWADTANPRFVDIVGPYKKWGGDNADAFYQYAPIDPRRTYRVRGKRGDAVYLSLTVYGGPDDGRYSERIVGTVNDRMLDIAPDGTFELVLSPEPHEGTWLKLEADAVCAITRDYLDDPVHDRRLEWHIEAVDPPAAYRLDDAELARRFRAAVTWLKDQANIVPLALGDPNTVDEPYPVPADLRVGRRRRRLRDGQLRPRRRRGARHRGSFARVRVLEHVPLEPVPAHVQLRLRARHDQRRGGAVRGRRLVDDRRRPP